ncbi:unnamed protein product [Dracunculus medinensis]|uniref:Amino acid transporter n=1 Tax=Dracunculus medinensis TaxID=318479 RepID=A0A0N4U6U4_DRAME|nr:unnamed protein product [Dracunculus medinensis]
MFLKNIKKVCCQNLLLTSTILSVFIGVILGFILREFQLSNEICLLINFPGEIFMQVLKMMILPLIFSSLTAAQMDIKHSGQMGFATVLYYSTTALLSTVVRFYLNNIDYCKLLKFSRLLRCNIHFFSLLKSVFRNMFPENILQASFQRVQTVYASVKPTFKKISKNATIESPPKVIKSIELIRGTNILGLIVFCTGFGIVISKFGERARVIINFFTILDAVITRWVEALMWFAPVGIICLITGNLLELEDLSDMAQVLLLYIITVIGGLTIHTFVVMPGLYFFIVRKNPLKLMQNMLQAVVTAFGTGSSGAALPSSMHCLEDGLGLDRRVTRFVLPLGTTINMDGNALYEAIAVIFIAQLNGVSLTFIATISSLGMGSVPAGLVAILLILNTIGLPTKDVPLLITVDWLLDRIRTMVNVLGDGFVAGSVAHLLHEKLEKSDRLNEYRTEIKEEIG